MSAASLDIGFRCDAATLAKAPIPQKTHIVQVGMQDQILFNPAQVQALPGDVVVFRLRRLNHSVTESSLQSPCQKTLGGFDSGFGNFNPDDDDDKVVAFSVSDNNPRWFFCAQSSPFSHCNAGMVFGLNPGNLMNMFLDNAQSRPPLTPGYSGPYVTPQPTSTMGNSPGTGNSTGQGWKRANSTVADSTLVYPEAQNTTSTCSTSALTVSAFTQTLQPSSVANSTLVYAQTQQPSTNLPNVTGQTSTGSSGAAATPASMTTSTSKPSVTSLGIMTFTGGTRTLRRDPTFGRAFMLTFFGCLSLMVA